MGGKYNNNKINLLKLIEYSGKPLFYLFTFLTTLTLIALQLIKYLLHKIASISLPKIQIKKPKLPKLKITILPLLPKRPIFFFFGITIFLTAIYFSVQFYRSLPSPYLLTTKEPHLSTKIYDRNGELLYKIYKDENRTLVSLEDISPKLIDATIAIEDKNFHKHYGISPKGIIRAAINNSKNSTCQKNLCTTQGGSTITQQLVKNALLTPDKTIERKLKEVVLSLWIETIYSKDEILEMYLNEVAYGGTAYGIEEASQMYFGKPAKNLNLAESAFLAGLPNAPTTYSPYGSQPFLSKKRQSQVLAEMVESGYITEIEKAQALNQPLTLQANNINIKAPHFVMFVKDYLENKYSQELITKGGLNIYTTLDLSTNDLLKQNINQELNKLSRLRVGNAAGIITNPKTGEVLAMVGSSDFFDFSHDGQVNVALQPRQPGSAIKPITYALAFSHGLTPSTTILDAPVEFRIKGQEPYRPTNYDNKFHGTVTLRTALASSYNVPAIKLLNSLGVNNMISLAKEMGITTWDNSSRFGLALTLGGGEVTMYDLATVYGVFANNGVKTPLTPIIKITDQEGKIIESITDKKDSKQVLSSQVAFQINDILSDNQARSPAFGRNSVLNIKDAQVAVKTGTSNDLRDNWTIGYTQDILVATWVGNNDNTPMSSVASGITGASPIWSKTISQLLKNEKQLSFNIPEEMIRVYICKDTNTLYCKDCPSSGVWEYYVSGTEPTISCQNQNFKGKILEGVSSKRIKPSPATQ